MVPAYFSKSFNEPLNAKQLITVAASSIARLRGRQIFKESMTIETKFNIGQRVSHSDNGIGTVVDICVSVDKRDTAITYTVNHFKQDNGNADFAGEYYEAELKSA